MFIIIIIIFTFFLLLAKIIIKDKLSLVFIQLYLFWWALLLSISTFNPYGLFPVSEPIYALLILSVFCFSLGFVFNKNIMNVSTSQMKLLNEQLVSKYLSELSKNKVYLFLLVFFSLFIFRYLLRYQALILLNGTDKARTLRFYVGEVFSYNAEIYFYNYFVETFANLVTIYIAFSIIFRRFKTTFFISLLFLYLFSAFGAGRGIIIELGFYVIFLAIIKSIIINNNELKKRKSKKPKSLYFILPLLFGLYLYSIFLSNYRLGLTEISLENFITGNDAFFSQIIIYCVGSFRALEYGIANFSNDIGFTFGSLTFGAIDEMVFLNLGFLGFDVQPSNFQYGFNTSSYFMIGHDQEFNALFTNVFTQYLDFGVLGVVIFSFFWGAISNKAIEIFNRTQSIFSLALVLFLFVVAILCALSWKLQSVSSFAFFILLYLFRKKNSITSQKY